MAVPAICARLRSSGCITARILTIGGGATEVMLEEVAKQLLQRPLAVGGTSRSVIDKPAGAYDHAR